MEQRKPPHRRQIQAPGRKPPQTIERPRTVRVDPDVWEMAMAHAVKLSGERGYIVTMKESLGDIVRQYTNQEKQTNDSENQTASEPS